MAWQPHFKEVAAVALEAKFFLQQKKSLDKSIFLEL